MPASHASTPLKFPTLFLTVCLCLAGGFQAGCASDDRRLGTEAEDVGSPNPAVYGADTFSVRKWNHRRPSANSSFYEKRCTVMDGKTYWSKTSYDCSHL